MTDDGNDAKNRANKNVDPVTTADYYEDVDILVSYDRFHFGDGLLSVKNFPLRHEPKL